MGVGWDVLHTCPFASQTQEPLLSFGAADWPMSHDQKFVFFILCRAFFTLSQTIEFTVSEAAHICLLLVVVYMKGKYQKVISHRV